MNFLAHLHLAEPTPESRLGSLLGDFVRGYPWDNRYPPPVWQAIMEHRFVDSYTDSHPSWQKSRDLLPSEMRRFAGIIVDIFYDYFLHRHWSRFSRHESLTDFVASVHDQLISVIGLAPPEATQAIEAMIRQGWLMEYASIKGIDLTLNRVSHRSPILQPIAEGVTLLLEHEAAFESHFLEFYPDLLAAMPEFRREIQADRDVGGKR